MLPPLGCGAVTDCVLCCCDCLAGRRGGIDMPISPLRSRHRRRAALAALRGPGRCRCGIMQQPHGRRRRRRRQRRRHQRQPDMNTIGKCEQEGMRLCPASRNRTLADKKCYFERTIFALNVSTFLSAFFNNSLTVSQRTLIGARCQSSAHYNLLIIEKELPGLAPLHCSLKLLLVSSVCPMLLRPPTIRARGGPACPPGTLKLCALPLPSLYSLHSCTMGCIIIL